jgi:hypothetical protein
MENNSKSIEDIKTIRKIMEESSRFLSLSGFSGVFTGAFAIAGALVAYFLPLTLRWQFFLDATIVLTLSILVSFYLSLKKARHEGKNFWTPVSKRLLINLFIPLATGGIFVLALLIQNLVLLIIPCFLVFYGLALVNAGKFTYGEIFYLGLLEIVTGLISAFFPAFGLVFWIIGFGILHIIYGLVMYRKYEA